MYLFVYLHVLDAQSVQSAISPQYITLEEAKKTWVEAGYSVIKFDGFADMVIKKFFFV